MENRMFWLWSTDFNMLLPMILINGILKVVSWNGLTGNDITSIGSN